MTPVHGPVAVTAPLPLFPDDSKSVAMIRHSMNVVKKAVTVVNPRQIPVIACDQPNNSNGCGQKNMERSLLLLCLVVDTSRWHC